MKKLFYVFVVSWIASQKPMPCVGKEPPDFVCIKVTPAQGTYETLPQAQAVAATLQQIGFTQVTIAEKKAEEKK